MVDDWGETEKGNVQLHGYWNISNKGLCWTQQNDLRNDRTGDLRSVFFLSDMEVLGFRPDKLCQACEGNFSDQQYYTLW